jgi:hypothetical protein
MISLFGDFIPFLRGSFLFLLWDFFLEWGFLSLDKVIALFFEALSEHLDFKFFFGLKFSLFCCFSTLY